jgi:hypothetical protein
MKSPRLLRPLFLFGAVLIAEALYLWLASPTFHNTTAGLIVLVFTVIIGLAVIVRDVLNISREIKEIEQCDDRLYAGRRVYPSLKGTVK